MINLLFSPDASHYLLLLWQALHVLRTNGVNVQMISQGASKVNISLIVNDSEAEKCVKALHQSFLESGDLLELTQSAGLGMALLHRCK
ncbi:hypothetical protein Peur_056881 [Populus x canadensis]